MSQVETSINQIEAFKQVYNEYPHLPIRVKYRYNGKQSENELKPKDAIIDGLNIPNVGGSITSPNLMQAWYWEIIHGVTPRRYSVIPGDVEEYHINRFLSKINLDDPKLEDVVLLYDGSSRLFPFVTKEMCKQKPVERYIIVNEPQSVDWVE